MANASVAESSTVPGLGDIFPSMLSPPEDPERVAKAADNLHLPVVRGVAAIGNLLVAASDSEALAGELSRETLNDLGWLLNHLGDSANRLYALRSGANYWIQDKHQNSDPQGRENAP